MIIYQMQLFVVAYALYQIARLILAELQKHARFPNGGTIYTLHYLSCNVL